MAKAITLGPYSGVYEPSYRLRFWKNGDPRKPIKGVNLSSVTAIQTSKNITDVCGTFTITLKDKMARHLIQEMDVVRIELRGHEDNPKLRTVMRGVVDTARQGGSADTFASREDSVVEGRCVGKYLASTSLFLPVWDPQAVLPTALIFGLGDAQHKVGGNTPADIYSYLVRRFVFGNRKIAGVSGIPNSRFWLDYKQRFNKVGFQIPFLQFDEDTMGTALKRFEILGFSEAWIDEIGRTVYRHPQWDAPASYRIHTDCLRDWDFARSDLEVATYVEVIPAGDPGIDTATAQALRAGRAPIPSSYLNANSGATGQNPISPEFVIETDTKGVPTAKGRRNHWYKLQRKLGVRPQQIISPLLFDQAQAQAQAEGLLRFLGRMMKSGQITIPGDSRIRLGTTAQLVGELDSLAVNRGYYIESVQHEYVENDHYDTTLQLTHGRDPWDPKWGKIVLPTVDAADLAQEGGILNSGTPGGGGGGGTTIGKVTIAAGANRPGVGLAPILLQFLQLVAGTYGKTMVLTTGTNHDRLTVDGNVSDHWDGHAGDFGMVANNGTNDGPVGDAIAIAALVTAGMARKTAVADVAVGGLWNVTWNGHRVQVIWKTDTGGDHHNHVHIGVR